MTTTKTTNFANSKKRMIMMGPQGGTFVKPTNGISYNPVAHHVKTPAGTLRKLKPSNTTPSKIKVAKSVRKTRSNVGKARKPYKTRKNKGMKRGPRFNATKTFQGLF